jgi:hypothetical protein
MALFKAVYFRQEETCHIPFMGKEASDFYAREKCESVGDLDSFLSLPTDGCYQLSVANCRQVFWNIFDAWHQNLSSLHESISQIFYEFFHH